MFFWNSHFWIKINQKLKKLLDALDEYQTTMYEEQQDISSDLAKDFILKDSYKFN